MTITTGLNRTALYSKDLPISDNGMARPAPQLLNHLPLAISDLALPNSSLFANLLQSCIESSSVGECRKLHARILKTHFSSESFILNRLVDVYAKCGSVDDARKLFDRMTQRNTFSYNAVLTVLMRSGNLEEAAGVFMSIPSPDQCSWSSMVSGFVQHGQFKESLEFFKRMHGRNFYINSYSLSSALSACAALMDLRAGVQTHALISQSPLACHVYMGSALINMYSKCGRPLDAECPRRV